MNRRCSTFAGEVHLLISKSLSYVRVFCVLVCFVLGFVFFFGRGSYGRVNVNEGE